MMSVEMLTGVFLIASISPMLTYTSLWQVKEWRIDRLKEHLRSEGWLRQLFGLARPVILACALLFAFIAPQQRGMILEYTLVLYALLSLAQIILRKQRYPVWTSKAVMVICGTLFLNALLPFALSAFTEHIYLWIAFVLLQPFLLFVVWLLLKPVDTFLKQRIMKKAAKIRATYENAIVIGITGSVGKTTTKELIAHILSEKKPLYTPAYVNSEMGVSNWLIRELPKRDPKEELILIVEMGAYKNGEIAKLCDIVHPKYGIVTFIGSQHIALFGSQEKLCKAKGELLQCLPTDGMAFVNTDCELCDAITACSSAPVTTIGTGGRADIDAFDIEETVDGIRFTVEETTFTTPLHGTHNTTNVLLAISAAEKIGVPREYIRDRLRSFKPPSHTFSVIERRGVTILDDTHNVSPESFRAALAWAKAQPMEEKVLITPGLIELGQKEDLIHRELGAIAADVFTRVIFTDKHGLKAFAQGFGKKVELVSSNTPTLKKSSLLVCTGRVNDRIFNRILP